MSGKRQKKAKRNRPPENPLVAEAGGLFANPAAEARKGFRRFQPDFEAAKLHSIGRKIVKCLSPVRQLVNQSITDRFPAFAVKGWLRRAVEIFFVSKDLCIFV